MDFYANDSLGEWTVNNKLNKTNAPTTLSRNKVKIEYEKESDK